jgi:hypothetical protein
LLHYDSSPIDRAIHFVRQGGVARPGDLEAEGPQPRFRSLRIEHVANGGAALLTRLSAYGQQQMLTRQAAGAESG